MNIAHWLQRAGVTRAGAAALLEGTVVVADYAGFATRAARFAGALRAFGVCPGDRVMVFSGNCPNYLVALFGCWWAGAVAVPVNAKLHAREAAWIAQNAGARLVVCSDSLAAGLADVCALEQWRIADLPQGDATGVAQRGAEDLAWLFYTSGTTGQPKGVQITHGMIAATSLAYPVDVDPVSPGDAALYAAPMSHGAGIYAPINVLCGARHVVPASGGFAPGEVLMLAGEVERASMFLAPTMVRRVLDGAQIAGDKGAGIKTIVYGGGPMYLADITEAVDWFGPKFVQIYGQGECPMAITALSRAEVADRSDPRWRERLMSVGRAQSVVEVRVQADPGEPGEIQVRGVPVMPGYWQNPEASANALIDGWLQTGDIGRMDADGYLTLVDRSKDVIISGGSNIYPREVEEVLLEHPGVHEVSVVGRADAEWGEVVVAHVVARAAVAQADLDTWCLDRIARFKRPKAYVFCDSLPKNAYGKVLKRTLRTG